MKAHIFRHQHGGAVTSYAFLKPPTDEQMAAMNAEADAVFGAGWGATIEVELIEDSTVPTFEERSETDSGETGAGVASAPIYVGSGVGHVENPEGFDPAISLV